MKNVTRCRFTAITLLVLSMATVRAQSLDEQLPILVRRIQQPMDIDGKLDEAQWYTGRPAQDFWQIFPTDSVRAAWDTEIYMVYDDDYLYVGAKCHTKSTNFVVPSLRRDYRAGGNDNLTFVFDTFQDRTNAIVFGMNPLGVTREALISNGGANPGRDFDEFWDNKWHGAASIQDDYWSCELAIPFSSLRFREGDTVWYFNSYRFDMQANIQSTWNRIPQNQPIMSLGYMGRMLWEEPLKKPGASIAVIPYTSAGYTQRFIEDGNKLDGKPTYAFNGGADAKLQVSAGLNLDLTANPDFSQVEVDQQVINLDRFEIFFPERRQFFLENADLFSTFGTQRINPFFSRRIGVTQDPVTGQNLQNPIYGGARLSGKINNDWRIGLLNMQAAPNEDIGQASLNYTVAAVQRKLFSRSNLAALFVNKQAFGKTGTNGLPSFNRLMGLDYNIASADNRVTGKVFYHRTLSPGGNEGAFAHGAAAEYRVKRFALSWEHQWVGDGYEAEMGFVPRRNFFNVNPRAEYFFYPNSNSPYNQHSLSASTIAFWMPDLGMTDYNFELQWRSSMRSTASWGTTLRSEYIYLFNAFDASGSGGLPLTADTDYRFSSLSFFYRSDVRPKFTYQINPSIGQYFNGYRYGGSASLSYRYQPYGFVAMNVNYTYVDLPEPYTSAPVFLLGPRIDLTFTKSLFLTTFFQYNQQIDNVNINARFQWRFAPVSDFFLVYTENYMASDFATRNRAIVAKLTYWLNT